MENRNEEEAREASCSKRELMLEAIVRKTCACDLVVDLTSGSYSTLIGKGVYAKLSALVGDAGDYDALMRRVLPAMTPAYRAIFEADFGLERLRLLRDSDEPGPCGTFPIELGGEWHWFEIQAVGPVAGTGLAVANVLIRNVTAEAEERDRRQKERAAAETSEAILHKLVGSLFGYILTIDLETLKYRLVAGTGLETSVRFLSQQDDYRVAYAAKMSHLNEAHARQMEDCFAPEKLQAEAAGGRRGFYRLIEHEAVVMGSRFWEEMSVYFGTDDAGRRVAIALIRDVTEAHDRFDAEREADRRANEAKSYFFSSVSHDIRTPLNAIVGYAELLRAGIEAASERDQALEAIVSNGHMLKELINDVLDLSKLESGKMEVHPEPSDVARLVREVLGSFALVCGRAGVRLVREVSGVPQVMVDSQRLRQILFNLVGNAVKFTKQGSITVSAAYADGRLVLSVKDTGCGIDPQYHERLMQPFVQAPVGGRHDGTGLGLAICRQLAKRMGGDLSLESEVGKGSVFTLSIPVAVASDCDATDRRQEAGGGLAPRLARDPTSTRVLIVDDSPVNLKVLSAMLKRVGCKSVIQADGGRSALEVLQAGNVDLVLTDLWMPDVDGQELVRAIRSQSEYASLPVYAVTADVEAVKDAAAKGFTGILLKPMTLQMLSGLFAGS